MMDVNGALVMLAQVGEAAAHTAGAAGAGGAMGWDGWFALSLMVLLFLGLAFTKISPDLVAIGVLSIAVLVLTGLPKLLGGLVGDPNAWKTDFTVADALSGFSNDGMITVAVLFIVAAALRETGGMSFVAQKILGNPKSVMAAQARMMVPIAAMSAFMNNTPLVAMMLPVIDEWSKKTKISVSKLMIPLSYATVLGGTCTLIGTSTNLVVHGLMRGSSNPEVKDGFGLFEFSTLGVIYAVVGIGYILIASRWLLPDRKPAVSVKEDPRKYMVEMMVESGSGLVGKTVEEAGLRGLPGLFLIEIERDGSVIPAVRPQEVLRGEDRLVFTGIVESVVDLQRIRGLKPATSQVTKLDSPRARRTLIEAVVSKTCPNVGKSIKAGGFRTTYNAVVIAVARQGERLGGKIGDIVLEVGDTLLLEAHPSFVEQQRNSGDFFLVSKVEDSAPPRHNRAWVALAILLGMVGLVTIERMSMLTAGLLAACLMVLTRCMSWSTARKSLDMTVLLIIAAAFGIGMSLERTGAAAFVAHFLLQFGGDNPFVALTVIYGVTMLFTELITNAAAASLVFPVAMATAAELGVDARPFAVAIAFAASACFATPIGYQTNLMVMGPGGYKFSDYLRFGIPMNLMMWAVASIAIPRLWSF